MSSLRDWKGYNEALVKRGLILLDLGFVADWSRELKAVNEDKEGARFRYLESFVKLLAIVHAYVLPYRQLEGFMRALSQHVNGLKAPDYTTIWWRIAKMKVAVASTVELDKDVTIAVNTKTKQILAIEVTKEDVGNARMMGRVHKQNSLLLLA
jgi:hypothetical protein